jgi:DNA-3-methyladenine glycosylase II
MLGLDVNLHSFYLLAENDPLLRDLVRPFVGMKPPRFPNLFEAIINGIACQQLSLVVGIGLLNKLAWNFGRGLSNESQAQHSFPDAVALLSHTANELRALGFSFAKARAVLSLARSVSDGQWNADAISRLPDGEAQKSLETLTGVGRWTAEYVLLRGLGRLHIFPADDVGARNNLQNWLGISEPLDYARTRRLLARWSGFGGLIYFNLLLKKLHDRGALQ